ncbi:MAG: hypothetical protein JXL97_17895 [Bacteroidales bacterium]|nr:hypothetical protein [Bacteroidales bacterium]
MIEQINNELLKLQDELSKFDGAVAKIAQAGEMSDTLIESSKDLQKSFGEHLDKIQGLFSEYMNKTYNHTQEKINTVFTYFQDRLKQEEKTLEKFSQLTDQNTNLTQEFIEKTASNNTDAINRIVEETHKNLTEEKEFVQMQMANFQSKLSSMIDGHEEKVKSEQQLLDNYLELASSTAELSKFLKTVDFPAKLKEINSQVEELKAENKLQAEKIATLTEQSAKINANTQKLVDDNTKTEILTKVSKLLTDNRQSQIFETSVKVKSKVSGTKFFVILTFVIVVLLAAFIGFAFFNFFPHFIQDIVLK